MGGYQGSGKRELTGGIGSDCLMGTGFSVGVMKCFGIRQR